MSVAAAWLADPSGDHELRYWDGSSWTDHVSDGGVSGTSVPTDDFPPPPPAAVPPPPPPAPAKSGGGWMDKVKAAATQAADQGKSMVDQAKSTAGDKSTARRQQYENDPNTLWMGESRTTTTKLTGMSSAFYRLTKDRVWIDSGVFGSKSENVPLWAVKDVDVRQSMFQSGTEIGDVVLILEDASLANKDADFFNLGNFTGQASGGARAGQVVLDNIEGPHALRDLLMPLISEARLAKNMERNSQYIHYATPPPTAAAPAPSPVAESAPAAARDLGAELRKLAALRDEGLLTDEEFAAQKAKLLNS
ncbi:MAG: PH domain-containing protein [Candidatus Nanopelagicales bacterium]|nr:DUF2510 domain-containing protein [Candidatus Nanopelagicales bacterium]